MRCSRWGGSTGGVCSAAVAPLSKKEALAEPHYCSRAIPRDLRLWAIFVATRRAHRDALALTSCSQNRITIQRIAASSKFTHLSRARFRLSFGPQYLLLLDGDLECSGHPCQKQPSTNTATRQPINARSGRPGNAACFRYLRPSAQMCFRKRSSGSVLEDRMLAMQRLRFSGDIRSI